MPWTTQELAEELAHRERSERERRGLPVEQPSASRYRGEMQADWAVDAMREKTMIKDKPKIELQPYHGSKGLTATMFADALVLEELGPKGAAKPTISIPRSELHALVSFLKREAL